MELRHLKYFCAVAEHRSFTLASRQLNVSQSGVSGQIRALESEIGRSLLRRNHREVVLTPEGLVFLKEARDILSRADRAIELAQLASRGQSGELTVGLCGPVTALFLPRIIRRFRKQFPGVSLAIRERAPSEQIDALLSRQIDIAFTRSVSADLRHLVGSELLFREPIVIAMPKGHPLAQQESVPVEELVSERLVLFCREGAPEVFDAIVAMCKKAKFSPKVADCPTSWHGVLTMVESNEGLGLVPQCVQHLRGNDVVFRRLRHSNCKLDAIVAWRRNEPNALQESFLALLRQRLSETGTL